MSKESGEFEQMVARVHQLLEGQDVDVQWNEKIPDPDNPNQPRQIDILVRKGDLLNHIECRIHKEKQDVNWIEELIGRRISLNADAVVAVSASGFTSGAIKKAAKYGIILNDLLSLTDEEIKSWSRAIRISIFFYRYDEFKIFLYFDSDDINELDLDTVSNELKNYNGLRTIFNAPADIIDEQKLIVKENLGNKVNFSARFEIGDFSLQGKVVRLVEVKGSARLEKIDLNVPLTLAYGSAEIGKEERNVYIQKFDLGQTSVMHHDGKISTCLDLSKLDVPPYWQFRFLEVAGQHENYHESLEIIEPEKINIKVDKVIVGICAI